MGYMAWVYYTGMFDMDMVANLNIATIVTFDVA